MFQLHKIFMGIAFSFLCFFPLVSWAAGAYSFRFPDPKNPLDPQANTVIGSLGEYTIKPKDTFLDVARDHDLGFNEMEVLYPDIDPWVPPQGMKVLIPSQWILPSIPKYGIIINIAEMRLFYLIKSIQMARTFPIGIGDLGWFSPEGSFFIREKRKKPIWYIPKSLQEKYGLKVMPPGPENPLGDYWLGLSIPEYGIHGTDFPWSVGRLVTHGCIRLYPEDIEKLFNMIPVKTPVEIIYEPVKLGLKQGRLYAEAHPDIYDKIPNFNDYGWEKIKSAGWNGKINAAAFQKALDEKNGVPVDVSQD